MPVGGGLAPPPEAPGFCVLLLSGPTVCISESWRWEEGNGPVLWASKQTLPSAALLPSEVLTLYTLCKSQDPYLEVALLAGQVEWDGLLCVSGPHTGTVLHEEEKEVRPTMQGSNVQWGGTILVGHIHTKPTGRNLCQLLISAECGNGNVVST